MEKAAHWVLDGEIIKDAGQVGGDIQVGPAISARFRSDDCPDARFEITVYATAKTYDDMQEGAPPCPHKPVPLKSYREGVARYAPMPEEHMACSWKTGTVDVQAQYMWRRNGYVDDHGNYESDDSDHITYEWVGSDFEYPGSTLPEQARAATKDAEQVIHDWVAHVNRYLQWDGRTEPKD